ISKMVRQRPHERYQSVAEVTEAFAGLSFHSLILGREIGPNEPAAGQMISRVNITGELDRAFSSLIDATPENIVERLRLFELKLDRLGDAYDHEADAIMRITGSILGVIDVADKEALLGLVQRFFDAAEKTSEKDFFYP